MRVAWLKNRIMYSMLSRLQSESDDPYMKFRQQSVEEKDGRVRFQFKTFSCFSVLWQDFQSCTIRSDSERVCNTADVLRFISLANKSLRAIYIVVYYIMCLPVKVLVKY